MKLVILLASTASMALGSAVALHPNPALPVLPAVAAVSPPAAVSPAKAAEVERIQAHLATVERELLGRDVSHLSPAQRAARTRHIRVLRAYRESGAFPHNHDFPDRRVPYFVDEHGTRCAVAHLIAESGREDLVARISATRNHATVPELVDDAELVAWLDYAGLTLEEAARIQPAYGPVRGGIDVGVARANMVAAGLGAAGATWNLATDPRGRWGWVPGMFGMAAGGFGIALVDPCADCTNKGADEKSLQRVSLTLSAASALLGARTLVVHLWGRSPDRGTETASRSAPSVSAAPTVSYGAAPAPGLVVRLKF